MTDTRQFILLAALAFLGFLIYQAWQEDYGQLAGSPPASTTVATAEPGGGAQPAVDAGDDLPAPQDLPTPSANGDRAGVPVVDAARPARSAPPIRVRTDVYDLQIDPRGGTLNRLALLNYPLRKSEPDNKVTLLRTDPDYHFVAETGLQFKGGPDRSDKRALYQAPRSDYEITESADSVELNWQGQGVAVSKTYRFTPGSYRIEIEQVIRNTGAEAMQVFPFGRLPRADETDVPPPPFVPTHLGGAYYKQTDDGYSFEKLDFDEFVKESEFKREVLRGANRPDGWATRMRESQAGGWVAMIQHHFVAASLPPENRNVSIFTQRRLRGDRYAVGWQGAGEQLAPGESITLNSALFIGPKLQEQMVTAAPGLELTVDYGYFTIFADVLYWVLEKLYQLVGNWGVAIILLTLLVKILFYKPSEWQYRSMAKMRKFAPKIKALKERYGDDRQKMSEAMMKLYRDEKFNPFGGCLPILIQMPVFIALYWVLIESVELRQAPFMLWLNDLTAPDPYYILPILFGISMFVQQKLMSSNAMMDPMQQRIMMFMPVGLTIFFALFPSGLVLYWVANNLFGMAQQFYIMRKVEQEDLAQTKSGAKPPAKAPRKKK